MSHYTSLWHPVEISRHSVRNINFWTVGQGLTITTFLCGKQLIKPVEMCNPKVDELSMMTYLSQFPNAKLKPGAPLRPKTNPARVRAYGPGMHEIRSVLGKSLRFRLYLWACPILHVFVSLSVCLSVCLCRLNRSYISENQKCKKWRL